jgi:proteic killer suppression protein
MFITFERQYLEDLYRTGKCNDKKHRFQPGIVKKYKFCIDVLASAPGIEALFRYPSLNYEMLKGDKAGVSSVRINKQYRIEFTVADMGEIGEMHVIVCNIQELSNHYQ